MSKTEITKVQLIIRRFLWETRDVVKDPEKSRIWLESFRNTLQYQDLSSNPEPYALALLSEARKFNATQLRNQQMRWVRSSLQKEGIDNPSKKQLETRWKEMYGLEEANETTEGAANGNNADVDTAHDSANAERTTAFENLGSGKPKAQNDQRRAGGISPLSVSTSSPSARSVDVLNLAYAGEFGNVVLSQEQYAQLGIRFGNLAKLNRAIDSLSCKIENGEKNPANHYAELVKWASYRDDMEEKKELEESKPKMTNMEKSWIAAMKRVEEM